MKKQEKQKKVIITLVAVVSLLAITLAVSITYNFLGGFYYCRVISFNKVLGEEQTIDVIGEGAYISACNYSGSLVVSTEIKQVVNVKTLSLTAPIYLRARLDAGEFKNAGTMFGFSNWQQATDGYVYYNNLVNSNTNLGLCNAIKLNVQQQIKSSTNYILCFVVEARLTPWEYSLV